MGVGEGDDMDGREKDGKRDRSGRKKERKRDRDGREKDRERSGRERETGGEKEGVTGEKEKKLQTQKKSCNFILSYFTPQNGVKHDSGL